MQNRTTSMNAAAGSYRKNERITAELRSLIVSNAIVPGGQLPTQLDLVRQFKVSPLTIQRAVNTLARDGFVRARRHHGTYVVDHPPHLFRFGLVFPRRPGGVLPWSRFLHAMLDAAADPRRAPRQVIPFYFGDGHADSEDFQTLRSEVLRHRLAGLIHTDGSYSGMAEEFLHGGAGDGLPRVFITAQAAVSPRVTLDGVALIEAGLDYLRSRQRRRIAVICTSELVPSCAQLQAIAEGLARRGMKTRPGWVHGVDKHRAHWTSNLVRMLMDVPRAQRPDGLLILDDNVVEHATAGLVAARVRVPEDLDVVAHCNFPWPTPAALPVVRLGFDVRTVLTMSLDILARQRQGGRVPAETAVAPVFEKDLVPPTSGALEA